MKHLWTEHTKLYMFYLHHSFIHLLLRNIRQCVTLKAQFNPSQTIFFFSYATIKTKSGVEIILLCKLHQSSRSIKLTKQTSRLFNWTSYISNNMYIWKISSLHTDIRRYKILFSSLTSLCSETQKNLRDLCTRGISTSKT